jgi:hypothetical protein
VLPSKESENEGPPTGKTSFESYGRLLTLLLPRLRGFAVHDGFSNILWSSPDWSADESGDFVRQAISAALQDPAETPALGRAIDNDRALYAFALRAENQEVLAVISLEVAITGSQNSARPVDTLRPFVQPAIDCLRRELILREALGSNEVQSAPLRVQAQPRRTHLGSEHESLDSILKCSFAYVGCALAALWIPERNLSISLTSSGNRMSPQLLQGPRRQLVESMQQHQRTIIVNNAPGPAQPDATAYKTLACPIAYPNGRFAGVLALFNPPSGADFEAQHGRSAELMAKCISVLISQRVRASGLAIQSTPAQQFG